jgi:RimJ/RimL family protein N-acetyltransferase
LGWVTPQRLVIETPRLQLSDFHAAEFAPFCGMFDSLQQAGQRWPNAQAERPETVRTFFDDILRDRTYVPRHTYRLALRLKIPSCETTQIIGYVSLCDIFSGREGRPDTGVFVDPGFQRTGYAREARAAIGYFGAQLGLETLFSEIRIGNLPSINNVTAMGYEQVTLGGEPVIVQADTITGVEERYRYQVTRGKLLDKLPHLLEGLAQRYWKECSPEVRGGKGSIEVIKITVSEDAG